MHTQHILLCYIRYKHKRNCTSKVLRSSAGRGSPLWNICVTNDHGYVTLVVNTS